MKKSMKRLFTATLGAAMMFALTLTAAMPVLAADTDTGSNLKLTVTKDKDAVYVSDIITYWITADNQSGFTLRDIKLNIANKATTWGLTNFVLGSTLRNGAPDPETESNGSYVYALNGDPVAYAPNLPQVTLMELHVNVDKFTPAQGLQETIMDTATVKALINGSIPGYKASGTMAELNLDANANDDFVNAPAGNLYEVGDPVTFRIGIVNNSLDQLTAWDMSVTLPESLRFESADQTPSDIDGNIITFSGDYINGSDVYDSNGNQVTGDVAKYITVTAVVVSANNGEEQPILIDHSAATAHPQYAANSFSSLDKLSFQVAPNLTSAEHHWYIRGYSKDMVRPEALMTRGEMAMVLYRLAEDEDKTATVPEAIFSDVDPDAWYAKAVTYLYHEGIFEGYPDNTFRPDQPVSRAEITKLATIFDQITPGGSITFSDVLDKHWASGYIAAAAANGIVNGYSDNTFQPDQYGTRAEIIAVFNRTLDRNVNEEGLVPGYITFSDITPDHWAYYEILEATNSHTCTIDNATGRETWTAVTGNGLNGGHQE